MKNSAFLNMTTATKTWISPTAPNSTKFVSYKDIKKLMADLKLVYAAPTDDSLLKMLHLAMMDITPKWTGHQQNWRQIHSQLEIYFGERLKSRNL